MKKFQSLYARQGDEGAAAREEEARLLEEILPFVHVDQLVGRRSAMELLNVASLMPMLVASEEVVICEHRNEEREDDNRGGGMHHRAP